MTEMNPSVNSKSNKSVHVGFMVFLGVVVVGTCAILTWKTQELIRAENLALLAEATEQKLLPVREHLATNLDATKAALVNVANRHEIASSSSSSAVTASASGTSFSAANSGSAANLDPMFEMVMLLKADSKLDSASAKSDSATTKSEAGRSELSTKWTERSKKGPLAGWPQGYETTLIKSMSLNNIKDGQVVLHRLAHPDGQPIWAMAISVEIDRGGEVSANLDASTSSRQRGYLVGFMQQSPMMGFIEKVAGPQQNMYVVDDRGYVMGHSKRVYLGSLFTEDPMVKEILRVPGQASHNAQYEDLESQLVLGRFERLSNTNLTLVHTSPASIAEILPRAQLRLGLFVGGQILLLALVLGFFVIRKEDADVIQPSASLMSQTPIHAPAPAPTMNPVHVPSPLASATLTNFDGNISGGSYLPIPPQKSSSFEDSIAPSVRMAWMSNLEFEEKKGREFRAEAMKQAGQNMAEALRGPLQAILGNSQMVSSKLKDVDVLVHTTVIEREARSIQSTLENLERLACLNTSSMEAHSIRAIVLEAIESQQAIIRSLEVRLEHDLADVPKIPAAQSELREAIQVLIRHSIESMRETPHRRLTIGLQQNAGKVLFRIQDTGCGMSELERQLIGDPFSPLKKTKGNKSDIDLAFVMDVLKTHDADVVITSEPNQGATYEIRFQPALFNKKSKVEEKIADLQAELNAELSALPTKTMRTEESVRFEIRDEDIVADFSELSVITTDSSPDSDDDDLAFLDKHSWMSPKSELRFASSVNTDINLDEEEAFSSMDLKSHFSSRSEKNDVADAVTAFEAGLDQAGGLVPSESHSTNKLRKPRLKG